MKLRSLYYAFSSVPGMTDSLSLSRSDARMSERLHADVSAMEVIRAPTKRPFDMMVLVAAILFHLLVSLILYLHVSGVLNTSSPRAFQFAFYILAIFFALTVGIGIVYDRPATTPLSLSEVFPEP